MDDNLLHEGFSQITWNELYYIPSVGIQSNFLEENIWILFDDSIQSDLKGSLISRNTDLLIPSNVPLI